MKINSLPKQKYLQSILDYNPKTGIFKWKWRKDLSFVENKRWCDKEAGTKNLKNIGIWINGKIYASHRLAYVYMYGDVLECNMQIDHKNTNPFDNRIANLRIATHSQNTANAKKWKNKLLPKGVSKQTKGGRYRVRLQVEKKVIYIGTYDTPEEAYEAYREAAKKYHGEFARVA